MLRAPSTNDIALLAGDCRKTSAHLGVLCVSALILQYVSFNAESRSTLRFAEKIFRQTP